MRTLQVSKNNQIAKFIISMREKTGRDWLPFPTDICELTRAFFLNLLLLSIVTSIIGFLLTGIILFWHYVIAYGVMPPDDGSFMVVWMIIGLITSIFVFGGLIYGGLSWLAERVKPMRKINNGIVYVLDKTLDRFGSKDESVIYAIWTSFKDKVCFKVELKDD